MRRKVGTHRLGALHLAMLGSLIAAFSSQGALIVSGVLTARLLGPGDRGHMALLVLISAVFGQVSAMGLPLATTHYLAQNPRRAPAIVRAIAAPAALQLVALVLLQAVTLWVLFADASTPVQLAAMLTLPVGPALFADRYGLAILQGLHRFKQFNVLRVLPPATNSIALLALVATGRSVGLPTVVLLWAATNLATAIATLIIAIHVASRTGGSVPAPPHGELVRFGLRGFLGSVSSIETFRVDQAAVSLFLSPVALGLYVTAIAFTNLLRFITQSIGMVASPHIAAIRDTSSAFRSMWRFFWFAVAICAAAVLVLAASVDRLVPLFFGAAFAPAAPIAQILLIHALLRGIGRVLGAGARGAGRPGANSIGEVVESVILIPALALLTPRWGLEGVALALVGASFFRLVVLFVVLRDTGRPTHALVSTHRIDGVPKS